MNILLWHVHGPWTTAFVQGQHRYLLPTPPGREPSGRRRTPAGDWPPSVLEIDPRRLPDEPVDVVVLQRPEEMELAARWLRRVPGRHVPAVFLEHGTPPGGPGAVRHPVADRADITLVHVTALNAVMWHAGTTRTVVIEHGVVDPGPGYTGELPHAAVVVDEPLRRARAVGTDLLPDLATAAPIDVFGRGTEEIEERLGPRVRGRGELPRRRLYAEIARRRVYLHPVRRAPLEIPLVEAMHLSMPVVVHGATRGADAVPPAAGVCSTSLGRLKDAIGRLVDDPQLARRRGLAARRFAIARYNLGRFLADWDQLLADVAVR